VEIAGIDNSIRGPNISTTSTLRNSAETNGSVGAGTGSADQPRRSMPFKRPRPEKWRRATSRLRSPAGNRTAMACFLADLSMARFEGWHRAWPGPHQPCPPRASVPRATADQTPANPPPTALPESRPGTSAGHGFPEPQASSATKRTPQGQPPETRHTRASPPGSAGGRNRHPCHRRPPRGHRLSEVGRSKASSTSACTRAGRLRAPSGR